MKPIVVAVFVSIGLHAAILLQYDEKDVIVIKPQEPLVVNVVVEKESLYTGDDWGLAEAIEDANELYPCLKRKSNERKRQR